MCSLSLGLPQSYCSRVLGHRTQVVRVLLTRSSMCSSVIEALIQNPPWLIIYMICCGTEELRRFWTKKSCRVGRGFRRRLRKPLQFPKWIYAYFPVDLENLWCLKELVMMLRKYDMGTSTLIPIFYDVKPAEVKYLKGAFGEGFENLQSKGRYSIKEMEQWRGALYKIGEIRGYEGKGELSMTIVKRICEVLDIGSVDTPRNVIKREKELLSMIHCIMKCRNNGLGVTSVEISGIGGIGKTTFAKELYNQIYTKYDRRCFIEDINGLVEKHGVDEVHRQIFSELFGDNKGKRHLKKRLHNAEILVVIDNIHRKIPLSTVFIEDDVSLNPRSTIIVTSREKGVLKNDFGVKGYCQNLISLTMETLDFDTSKKIFCDHAFGGIYNVKNEFNEMIEKIVTKCAGVPLALTLLGKNVYEQDIMFWKSLWSSMKDCLHGDVKEILKFSYDNLGSDLEKCLFLDIATFFRWEKEDLLLDIRQQSDDEDGELKVQYALRMLKRNLLINVSKEGILGMHDVLVDLGKSIIKDENLCPGHRSRVWSPSDVTLMLSEERGTTRVKALTLVSGGSPVLDEDQHPWSVDVFSELSSLEILILSGHCIEGDFSKLSKRLLWLKWTDFPYQKIPQSFCLKHMRVLHMSGKELIHLWNHPSKEAPSKLRKLILGDCIKLQRLPEWMGKLRQLSSIDLYKCKSLIFIPESFGQLQGLKNLSLQDCQALEQLPGSIGQLLQLSSIRLRKCTSLKFIPESFGQLQGLKDLYFDSCHALERLPESFGKLLQLENLHITHCYGVKSLPESFKCLANLHFLKVVGCPKIKFSRQQFQGIRKGAQMLVSMQEYEDMELADSRFDQIGNMEHFWRNYSKWHCSLTQQDNFRRLLREVVEAMQIKKTRDPASNINNNGGASHLSDFEAIGFHLLESFENPPLHCPSLLLHGFWNLRELPLPQSLGNIRVLHLHHCCSLQRLPDSVGSLSQLDHLILEWCYSLQELPDTIGNLPNLRSLGVTGCFAFKGFPSSLRNLSSLIILTLQHCWMVEVIHTEGLFNLIYLVVCHCINLKSMTGLSDLRKLNRLDIKGCMKLRYMPLPVSVGDLYDLRIVGCYQLCFPEDFLERLPLERLPPEYGLWNNNDLVLGQRVPRDVTAKTSPLFFGTVKEKVRHVLSNQDTPVPFPIHELSLPTHVPSLSLPFNVQAVVVCFVSTVYTDAFPDHIPLPAARFSLFTNREGTPSFVRRYDLGEEIHVWNDQHIESGDFDLDIGVTKQNLPIVHKYYPSYEAHVKEGFIVFLGLRSLLLTSQIHEIFLSELKKQRLMSRAWTQLPSQLQIHEFSALDIAGCQITKISRHYNTCIMEEETSLTWNRRRCIFTDDHALLLQHSKISKHSFLAYPGVDHDLETSVANLYEMSISVLVKGKVVHSRKLQQISPKTNEEIPFPLNSLLQQRAFHSTSETMRRIIRLGMLNGLTYKYLQLYNDY